jgi:oligopeptide/dipeptide ABC transporter ATP-binding protein
VTIEAQILALITRLQRAIGMAVIFVTHDLGVIAQVADRVAVMYAGSIVEEAPVQELFDRPRHPYTIALLKSSAGFLDRERRLFSLGGSPPDLARVDESCPFAPRCQWRSAVCDSTMPSAVSVDERHTVACHHQQQIFEGTLT